MFGITGKYLKLLILLAVIIFAPNATIIVRIQLGLLAYLVASLWGIVLEITRNYIVAFAVTVAILLFICFKMDQITSSSSWFSESLSMSLLFGLAVFLIIRDVKYIINARKTQEADIEK